nr:hypothetical protein Iba_chr06eCG6710 [Ipomoea batatas]
MTDGEAVVAGDAWCDVDDYGGCVTEQTTKYGVDLGKEKTSLQREEELVSSFVRVSKWQKKVGLDFFKMNAPMWLDILGRKMD